MSISRSLPPLFLHISSNIWFRGRPRPLGCCLHHVGKILEEPRPGLKQPWGLTCMFSVCCYAEQQEYFNTCHFYHGNHKRRQSTSKLYWVPPKGFFLRRQRQSFSVCPSLMTLNCHSQRWMLRKVHAWVISSVIRLVMNIPLNPIDQTNERPFLRAVSSPHDHSFLWLTLRLPRAVTQPTSEL